MNPDVVHSILETGAIPVIPLASDETGRILNVNADTMAVEIAIAVSFKVSSLHQRSGI